jgi:FtsP/CotA-like multicopper oxidase with cupredoxin domain
VIHGPTDATRRRALGALGAAALAPMLPVFAPAARAQPLPDRYTLRAAPARLSMLGPANPQSDLWVYNGRVPGPVLRVRQGDRLRVDVVNDLPEATTVHWHGLRLPNAMDGVPHLTQPPIAAGGGRFTYEFACPDAGTFWYHPHLRGNVQVEMGLAGALIVEEPERLAVDRDVLWVLDDWRMQADGQVSQDFGSMRDFMHDGRIGNTVTINGTLPDEFAVEAGERIRLRLLNVANARIFALRFEGHAPTVIAQDGMPCEPHAPQGGRIVLGPGMRADVILDATGKPGERHRVIDDFFARQAYEVVTIAYDPRKRARVRAAGPVPRLAANPVPEPDPGAAERHRIVFSGGMMGMMGGGARGMMGGMPGMGGGTTGVWAINGHSSTETDHSHAPLLTLARGRSHVLELVNDTAWWHPIHLHGHSFRVITRNGTRESPPPLVDTSLLPPRERAEIAFVADNPGDWMFHCHVLEHQASGMMATIRVA